MQFLPKCDIVTLSSYILWHFAKFPGGQNKFRKDNLLNYEEFIEYVRTYLTSRFEPDTSIFIHQVLKNNNTQLDGISVLKKDQTISPTLYLNDFYQEYLYGTPLEDLLDDLYHCFLHPYTSFTFSATEFKNFNLMKDRIVYRLINYSKNQALLADIPHRKFLDLAIVYYLLLHSSDTGNACIIIRNEHMSFWNVEPDTLHQHAEKNTPLLLPAKVQKMDEIIHSFLSLNPESEDRELFGSFEEEPSSPPLYVLTNQSHLNGASVLLYKNLLKELSDTIDESFYILPSSIHEIILVPSGSSLSKTNLNLMVQDVNQKEVSPMERLSDHVYFYNRLTRAITM